MALLLATTSGAFAQERARGGPPPRIDVAGGAWLGFSFEVRAERRGDDAAGSTEVVTVREVRPGSPAATGGVQAGDVLLRVNGLTANERLIRSLASFLEPGDTVRLRVSRQGTPREFTLIAAERPADMAVRMPRRDVFVFEGDSVRRMARVFLDSARLRLDSLRFPRMRVERDDSVVRYWHEDRAGRRDTVVIRLDTLRGQLRRGLDELGRVSLPGVHVHVDSLLGGMFTYEMGARSVAGAELTEVSPSLGDYFGTTSGVLVLRVGRDTPAQRAGLEPGDVITKANDRAVTSIRELRREVAMARPGGTRLDLLRKQKAVRVTITHER